jgi:hypothetical protein
MSIDNLKLPLADDPVKLMDLGMKIYARHCLLGNKSPLIKLESNSWEENGPGVNNALRLHELIEEGNLSQECSNIRDELIAKIKVSIQTSMDLLLNIYADPSELVYWGFDSDDL